MSEPTPAEAVDPLDAIARLFDRAVRALGEAGEPVAACRLAAEAWWLLREPCPGAARRLNATLHRLALPPAKSDRTTKGEPCPPAQTRRSTSAASHRPAATT